jgi:shikimate kinase / 3-dehydroquinate synthase
MTRFFEPSPPVVVLTGFMGTGKSEVGRELASLLGVPFIDTDSRVEEKAGITISDIFKHHGEARFRQFETEICDNIECPNGAVIATGGGTIIDESNYRRLAALGTLVLIESTVDDIAKRLERDSSRPLLAHNSEDTNGNKLRATIRTLLKKRQKAYGRVSLKVSSSGRTPGETAAEISSLLGPGCSVIDVSVDVRPLPVSRNGNTNNVTRINPGDLDPGNVNAAAASRQYLRQDCRIVIGRGAAGRIGNYLEELGLTSRAFLFVPKHLGTRLLKQINPSLDAVSIPHEMVPIADGDNNKNLAQVRDLIDRMAASRAGRDSVIVSVGGGVAGDLAGFVAAIYMRGLPFVQVPTTLISQVDASIGGKVGVNHPRAKNLIGSIYQPVLVLNDPLMLEDLPLREISNGMAEVVRTAIIGSPELYDYLAASVDRDSTETLKDPVFVERCVMECARVKADVVERDPYERDLRRVLNLGHTLGHALESALDYEEIKHGEAVGIGIIAAIRVAMARGRASEEFLRKTIEILKWCGLPTVAPRVDRRRLKHALKLDKKVKSGNLFFILPLDVGSIEIVGDVTEDELLSVL